jgi:hypothetical protein
MVRSLLLATLLAVASGCTPASFTHFDTTRAGEVALGQSRDQVTSIVGEPHHILRVLDHPKRCVERWRYTDMTGGVLLPNQENLVVDFDAKGNVCDLGHARIESTWSGPKTTVLK